MSPSLPPCLAGAAQPGCCSIRCRSLRQCHGRSARPPSPPARPSPALALHRDPAMRAMIPSGSCVGPPLPRCLHVYMLACPLVKLAHLIGRLAARLDLHRRLALGRRVAKGGAIRDMVGAGVKRSEEHTSELQSLMRISYAVFCLKKKKKKIQTRERLKIKIDHKYK